MFRQREAIGRYNYYNDPRVRESMFSSCWKVVDQGAGHAIIQLDEDFVVENIYEPEVRSKVERWVEVGADFTQDYRNFKAKSDLMEADRKKKRSDIEKEHGAWWKIPKELQDELNAEYQRAQSYYRETVMPELSKLYDKAESETDMEAVFKEMGIEDFCMRLEIRFEVCHHCEGHGAVVNPRIDASGISREDFDFDPDFEEDYFAGRYDIKCTSCKGLRVEAHPRFPEWLKKLIDEYDKSMWEAIDERCADLRMGA